MALIQAQGSPGGLHCHLPLGPTEPREEPAECSGNAGTPLCRETGVAPTGVDRGLPQGTGTLPQVKAFASSPSSDGPSRWHLKGTSTAESTAPTGSRAHGTPCSQAGLQGG